MLSGLARGDEAWTMVDVASRPQRPSRPQLTETLANPPAPLDMPRSRFGGCVGLPTKPSGYFRVERTDNRWWLVDPDGFAFLSIGANSVRPLDSPAARAAFGRAFGSQNGWAAATIDQLRLAGFNTLGAWSAADLLGSRPAPLPYVKLWSFMAAYGRRRGGTVMLPGHVGYPGDCPFIFDPEFPAFCDEYAAQLALIRDDPWLIGHCADNELPWSPELLDRYLALPTPDAGHRAAQAWLAEARGGIADGRPPTDAERSGFLEHACETYLITVAQAIRRHDPHHLFLGMRLHGQALRRPEVFRACGRHCDVVSLNYYHAWTPDPELLSMWATESGRPFIVTEFYAKGADSGLGNTSGAGWLVPTQADRGRFYQHFTLSLLRNEACVGWHWHRYSDNDPDEAGVDPSNHDSNKGIVSSRYEPWTPLLAAMTAVNLRAYGLRVGTELPAGAGLGKQGHRSELEFTPE